MTITRLLRSEFRKLTTTKMPWAFLGVLILFAGINAAIVVAGTDMDGSKTFISTELDQRSLTAFASNGFILAALFGAIAVSREYGYRTVVPTFLASPRRHRAVGAQLVAVAVGGGVLSLVGTVLTVAAVAGALPTTDYGFLISGEHIAGLLLAAVFAGATGAVLGAGIGAVVRTVGGAVTGTVLALVIVPPLIVQAAADTGAWIPNALAAALSGVGSEVGSNVSSPAAAAALVAWALIPAIIGLVAVERRDIA